MSFLGDYIAYAQASYILFYTYAHILYKKKKDNTIKNNNFILRKANIIENFENLVLKKNKINRAVYRF